MHYLPVYLYPPDVLGSIRASSQQCCDCYFHHQVPSPPSPSTSSLFPWVIWFERGTHECKAVCELLRRPCCWPSAALSVLAKGAWDFAQKAVRPASCGGTGLRAISQLPLQAGCHVCVLCCRKEGDSEFMNIIANEIGSEVRGM